LIGSENRKRRWSRYAERMNQAFGLVLLLVLISAAVIGYFRKHGEGYSLWVKLIAPAMAVVTLGAVFIMIVANFNVLIGSEGSSTLSWLLPAIAVLPGVAGLCWGLYLRSARPDVYAGIGHGGTDN
jgi:hypothetical protein